MKGMIVQLGMRLLGRGLVSCSKIEPAVKQELKQYDDGFVIELSVLGTDRKVAVKKQGEELTYLGHKSNESPDLAIQFKNNAAALMLILGQIGLYEGYAQHRFIVHGDFLKAMPFVRILYYVEAYLFPTFISKNILKEQPKRAASKAKAYLHLVIQ